MFEEPINHAVTTPPSIEDSAEHWEFASKSNETGCLGLMHYIRDGKDSQYSVVRDTSKSLSS